MGRQVITSGMPYANWCQICMAYHQGGICSVTTPEQRGRAVELMLERKTMEELSAMTNKSIPQLQEWLDAWLAKK